MRNLAALLALVIVGCIEHPDTMQSISPDAAKAAVIALVREHPGEFIGNPDPEMLDELALTDMGDGTWVFGAFTVCPAERRYSALVDVGSAESYLYEGKLKTSAQMAFAVRPSITRYHAAIDDPEY